jgi:MFS transporter, putative metabolite:H+ symporter
MTAMGSMVSQEQIAARIERLPMSRWHARILATVGAAHFFDAFDALTIAFVLPVLVGLWHITPQQIGFLISSGYIGQLIGAIGLGWAAEYLGRLRVLQWTILLIAVLSIACAAANSYQTLVWCRFVQGIGLGAEVPIAASYLNEFSKAQFRGRLLIGLQSCFAVGVMVTSLIAVWVVPNFGWRWMFVLGAVPAVLAIAMRRLVPESPRWLASRGRLGEADATLSTIESAIVADTGQPLPPLPARLPGIERRDTNFFDLFQGVYLKRTLTVWAIAFLLSTVGYGLVSWLPTFYTRVLHVPVQEALMFSFITNFIGLAGSLVCIGLIDRIGRRACFLIAFFGGALPMLALWQIAPDISAMPVFILSSIAYFFMTFLLMGIYVYAPELYPTRMRALGAGVASSWLRIASVVGPTVVGLVLAGGSIGSVFLIFGLAALLGGLVVLLFATETRMLQLEEIAH